MDSEKLRILNEIEEESFNWSEFNDECNNYIPSPLAPFTLTPGIKKPELLVSSEP